MKAQYDIFLYNVRSSTSTSITLTIPFPKSSRYLVRSQCFSLSLVTPKYAYSFPTLDGTAHLSGLPPSSSLLTAESNKSSPLSHLLSASPRFEDGGWGEDGCVLMPAFELDWAEGSTEEDGSMLGGLFPSLDDIVNSKC